MKKSILNFGKLLNKGEQLHINGGEETCTPEKCAEEYNKTAFEQLPSSSFKCEDGVCLII